MKSLNQIATCVKSALHRELGIHDTPVCSSKRFAAISIDLDTAARDLTDDWMAVQDASVGSATYTKFLPRFLDLLGEHGVRATLFVVGEDLRNPVAREAIRRASKDGHEIANHTMHHNKQFVRLGPNVIGKEIAECGKVLSNVTGQPVRGFRAPGYTVTREVIDALRALGYLYDSSLNCSWIYNGAKRLYKRFLVKDGGYLTVQDICSCLAPREPYFPRHDDIHRKQETGDIVEIPITLVPYLGYPYVSALLVGWPLLFSRVCYRLIRWRRRTLNFELHDTELSALEDFPASQTGLYLTARYMRKPLTERRRFFREIFTRVGSDFRTITLSEMADEFVHASLYRHC